MDIQELDRKINQASAGRPPKRRFDCDPWNVKIRSLHFKFVGPDDSDFGKLYLYLLKLPSWPIDSGFVNTLSGVVHFNSGTTKFMLNVMYQLNAIKITNPSSGFRRVSVNKHCGQVDLENSSVYQDWRKHNGGYRPYFVNRRPKAEDIFK